MKKVVILLVVSFSTILCFCQKLERNEVDEFTGHKVKETSWEVFASHTPLDLSKTFGGQFRICRVNDSYFFDLRLSLSPVFSVDKGQVLMFKLDNNDVVQFPCTEYKISKKGGGVSGVKWSGTEGLYVTYIIDKEQLDLIKDYKSVKVRVYTSKGYAECDIKDSDAQKIIKALKLVE